MTTIRTAVLVHGGGMRFAATTGTGRTPVFGDHPAEAELSPVEIVVAALAACSAMDVVSIALKKRQDFVRYEVHVRAEQRDEYPQVLSYIDVVHELEGDAVSVDAIRSCITLSASKYCPVNAMLSAGATEIHHRMRILRSDSEAIEEEVIVTGPYRRPEVLA